MAGLFIMGGSTFYTLQMLQSFKQGGIADRFERITLFGRNSDRLSLIAEAGSTLVGDAVVIDWTTKFEDCLSPDYTLIFSQIRFGGLSARDTDEKIAIEVGLPADETLGIVGTSNAIRTIQGIQSFAEVLTEKEGDFRLINFTNPCSIVCQYLSGILPGKVIGVCDYPAYMRAAIAAKFGIEPADITMDYFGLNHFGVVHDLSIDGSDVLAQAIASDLPFMPQCNRHFESLLNVSWRFVFEAQALVAEQRAKPNRASALLAFEDSFETLLNNGERDPAPYLEVLAQRQCDWYNLAVTPVFRQLLGVPDTAVFVNCAIQDPFSLGLSHAVIECEFELQPIDAGHDQVGQLTGNLDIAPSASLQRSPEYHFIVQMKRAETILLDAILTQSPSKLVRSCLINPTIREATKVQQYFERLQQVDNTVRQFFAPREPVSLVS